MEGLEISVQAMADVNRKLGQFADAVRQPSLAIDAGQMSAVLAEVVRVGEWTRDLPANADARLAEELHLYRSLLELLRESLPALHARLLMERSRLEAERTHFDAASAWARSANHQTP